MGEQLARGKAKRHADNTGPAVAVAVDEAGRITAWSEAAEQLYGYRAQEALGRPLTELFTSPANERRLQAIFDASLDAILLTDDEGHYQDVNPAACELLGYTREELLTLSVWDITPEVSREEGRRMWQAFLEAETMSGEYTVQRKDGTTRELEFRAVSNVQPHCHLSVLRDVTERKKAEKQLRQHAAIALLNAQLYQRAQEMAALEERQRLARELHDAVVQTLWSVMIMADVLPDVWQKDRQKGLERLQRLRSLTRGALAEMRALLVELRPAILEEHDLKELLEQLLEAAGSRTRASTRFSASGSCQLPLAVQYACYRIAQEALNNVVRHARPSHIELQLVYDEAGIELTIADDGLGFKPQQVGAGHLGLSIMRERAAEVDARFRVTTASGQGTRVQVSWSASEEVGCE